MERSSADFVSVDLGGERLLSLVAGWHQASWKQGSHRHGRRCPANLRQDADLRGTSERCDQHAGLDLRLSVLTNDPVSGFRSHPYVRSGAKSTPHKGQVIRSARPAASSTNAGGPSGRKPI